MQIKLLDIINELRINQPIIIARQCPNPDYIEVDTNDNPWLYLQSRNSNIGSGAFRKENNNYIIYLFIGDELHIDDLEKFKESLINKGIRFSQTGARGGKITKASKFIYIIINERYFKII